MVDHTHLRCGWKSLIMLIMLYCEECEFSSNGGKTITWCNSAIYGQIWPKFHMLHKTPGLKTSIWQNSFIVLSPPSGNWKVYVLYFYVLLLAGSPYPLPNFVTKILRPWLRFLLKIVSFHGTLLPWRRIIRHETCSCFWRARYAQEFAKLGTYINRGENRYVICLAWLGVAKWLDCAP